MSKLTDGDWEYAEDWTDRNGSVTRHAVMSRLAPGPIGGSVRVIALRIDNESDARCMAASKKMLAALKNHTDLHDTDCLFIASFERTDCNCDTRDILDAIAAAESAE